MGSSTQQTSQTGTSTRQPWGKTGGLLNTALKDIGSLYRSGQLAGYTGPTTASFSNPTMQSFRQMQGNADRAAPGFNAAWNTNLDQLRNPLSTAQQASLDQYGSLARGDHMGKANPYLDDLIQQGQDSARSQINAQTSGMGRYGSAVHQGELARELAGIETNARFNDYNNQLQRQDAAMAAQANLGQQGVQNRMAAQSAMPGLFQAMNMPAEQRRMVGMEFENQRQGIINDQIRRGDMQFNSLQKLAGLLGIAAPYATTNTSGVTTQPGPSPFLQGLGALGTVGSLMGGGGANTFQPSVRPF